MFHTLNSDDLTISINLLLVNKIDEYKMLLINYYESNNDIIIKKFIKKYCYIEI